MQLLIEKKDFGEKFPAEQEEESFLSIKIK